MSDIPVRINALYVYPIKSGAGIASDSSELCETGLTFDRQWMVVDASGLFVTQRELPRMALIQPTLKTFELVLRAPGMLALHINLNVVERPCRVRVWNDDVAAYDMGAVAAQWMSDFLGRPLRLVRFDPAHRRLSSRDWCGDIAAANAFSDGYPILVISTASLDELNHRLHQRQLSPVSMARFRPNLVLDGLEANGEDFIDEISLQGPDGSVRLKLVKPCSRCTIPGIDPESGVQDVEPSDTLATYRADARLNGAITFGMNAVFIEGLHRRLQVGNRGTASIRF